MLFRIVLFHISALIQDSKASGLRLKLFEPKYPVLVEQRNSVLLNVVPDGIKFVELKDRKKILFEEIVEKTNSQAVGMIGHVAILFRQNTVKEKRKIDLPVKK